MRNLVLLSTLLLTGCVTAGAEPERYAGFDCQQLSALKQSYNKTSAGVNPFADSDLNEYSRHGSSSKNDLFTVGQSRSDLTPGEVKYEKDINSIRAASRLKGC